VNERQRVNHRHSEEFFTLFAERSEVIA